MVQIIRSPKLNLHFLFYQLLIVFHAFQDSFIFIVQHYFSELHSNLEEISKDFKIHVDFSLRASHIFQVLSFHFFLPLLTIFSEHFCTPQLGNLFKSLFFS